MHTNVVAVPTLAYSRYYESMAYSKYLCMTQHASNEASWSELGSTQLSSMSLKKQHKTKIMIRKESSSHWLQLEELVFPAEGVSLKPLDLHWVTLLSVGYVLITLRLIQKYLFSWLWSSHAPSKINGALDAHSTTVGAQISFHCG